MLLLILL
ncbi:hypothetical protein A3Q56_08747 [Intoshia linei]|nr:hypothetical protein A3Q56_08747 [Intoshia linei]